MEQTHLLANLSLLLLAALGGGTVAYLLRQPLIVGYILGGILVSPFTPGPRVSNPQAFETFADIGVVLLMFSIGVEFSLQELLRVRKVAVVGGPAAIIFIILVVFLVGWLLGWPVSQRLVIGATISVCSTMVLLKFLQDRGDLDSPHGRIAVGIALVGDLAVVAMIVLLPTLNPTAGNHLVLLLQALLKGVLILGPFFFLARQVARVGDDGVGDWHRGPHPRGRSFYRARGLSGGIARQRIGVGSRDPDEGSPHSGYLRGDILRVDWSARSTGVSRVADSHDPGLGAAHRRRKLWDLVWRRARRRICG
ncbi:MAG: hypothetical protein E6H04_14585 [Bacillati bacterium ANGP1]|uniref:Cation/H+ exchanger transmembrane domain-containing protein n=1 Tax=Candidatus Segetimicrobium genomatis TaxID=2569760 RepID=A0A537J0C4_9BACT|nr:MAG: hypothetical protein E6H04_14585 [Terrabacteria group bacterium ANGP1]